MHSEAIDNYLAGAELPAQAILGLSETDLKAFPVPGTWSIQQIALHLMDSDLIASDRMKRVIAEDNPLIIAYNETRFTERLGYQNLDAHAACELFRLNRVMTAGVLRQLPAEAFARTGVHNERGKITLLDFVRGYHDHLHHHLRFLHEKRRKLGR